jgi:hypothetical protein
MALAPAHTAEPLSDDAVALLRRGAADHLGLCCRPGEVVKLWPAARVGDAGISAVPRDRTAVDHAARP